MKHHQLNQFSRWIYKRTLQRLKETFHPSIPKMQRASDLPIRDKQLSTKTTLSESAPQMKTLDWAAAKSTTAPTLALASSQHMANSRPASSQLSQSKALAMSSSTRRISSRDNAGSKQRQTDTRSTGRYSQEMSSTVIGIKAIQSTG